MDSEEGLEQLRDFFDHRDLGLILIGMPGFDRQLARYPQLHSRIGFAHQYKPLDSDDLLLLGNYRHRLLTVQLATLPYRWAARARALAASVSRFFAGADVTRSSSRCLVMCATSATA